MGKAGGHFRATRSLRMGHRHGGNSRAGALACHEEAAGGARLFFLLLAQLEPVDFVARPDSCEAGVVPLLPDALRLVAADSAAAAGVAGGRPPGLVCFGGLPGPGGGGGSGAKKLLMRLWDVAAAGPPCPSLP